MAHRASASATAPLRRSSAKQLYSYQVSTIGDVEISQPSDRPTMLRFPGRLRTTVGRVREQLVIVENTDEQPDLVDRVLCAIGRGRARLLVSFDRVAVPVPGNERISSLRAFARVEALLDEPAAAAPQLQLVLNL